MFDIECLGAELTKRMEKEEQLEKEEDDDSDLRIDVLMCVGGRRRTRKML